MTLQERLDKLTANEILDRYFVLYLPTGKYGKEIELLSMSINETNKAVSQLEEQCEAPGISRQQKENIEKQISNIKSEIGSLEERLNELLEDKDIIYRAYNYKIGSNNEVQPSKVQKRNIVYGDGAFTPTSSAAKSAVEGADLSKFTLSDLRKGRNEIVQQASVSPFYTIVLERLDAAIKEKEVQQAKIDKLPISDEDKKEIEASNIQNVLVRGSDGTLTDTEGKTYTQDPTTGVITDSSGNVVYTVDPNHAPNSYTPPGPAPFDLRLRRSDLFLNGAERIPFSSDEAAPILSDLIDFAVDGKGGKEHPGHVSPASKKQYEALSKNADVYGTLSLVNPYTVTRLYHGLDNLKLQDGAVSAGTNRMLDIRDQKRFYDIKTNKDSNDVLSVSNPTTSNIIQLMNNDKWGRTPYSYQDFVFCKYFGRIPNNRMITLRKYAAPTYDNLCWELMGADVNDKLESKFAPVATCVTYFGGDTGNNLNDIFKIKSGLNWGKVKANIWDVNGDAGDVGKGQSVESTLESAIGNFGVKNAGIFGDVFPTIGKISSKTLSLAKFFGIAKSPYAFDENAANAYQLSQGLHDPNTNGPYANRIQGPLNRIDEVYKREVGIKFENSITLKFAYKAHPIGGINTKAVMLDIMSNLLTMCSATAVFWGGGHRFMITPREYPWTSTISAGLLKDMYNGKFFGSDGAIRKVMDGFINAGGSARGGGWNWNNALNALGNLGMGVLGVLSGAVNTLLGSLSGQLANEMQTQANNLLQKMGGAIGGSQSSFSEGKKIFTNIMSNSQAVWRSNALKQSILPSVQGMRSILIGTPVGNWHLTIGNPLNPIAVIGNLICEDVTFNLGQELGPDDFPDELEATITLQHGMARDMDAIESMFNRGAGRIYQAPDYARMFAGQVSSDLETKVDGVTGGTSSRVPVAFQRVDSIPGYSGPRTKGYGGVHIAQSTTPSNQGSTSENIVTPINNVDVVNLDYTGATPSVHLSNTKVRAMYAGNWATRKLTDG